MIDAKTITILQAIVRKEGQSLLQYVGQAFPWTTLEHEPDLDKLRKIVNEDQEAVAVLAQLLTANRAGLPYQPGFPADFTTINFISLDHLVPRLVKQQQATISQLQADLGLMTEHHARAAIEQLITTKKRHLAELQSLAAVPV